MAVSLIGCTFSQPVVISVMPSSLGVPACASARPVGAPPVQPWEALQRRPGPHASAPQSSSDAAPGDLSCSYPFGHPAARLYLPGPPRGVSPRLVLKRKPIPQRVVGVVFSGCVNVFGVDLIQWQGG